VRRTLIPFATAAVIGTSGAAVLLPLNGRSTGELSALYPTGFTPAGWVFSIWSLIYLGLVAFSVWAVVHGGPTRGGGSTPSAARLRGIVWPYLVSCAANASWIGLWHHQRVGASVLVMLVLLASLVVAAVRLQRQPASSLLERVVVDGTFSLYLGWIVTAALANFGAWFFALGRYPFGLAMDQGALVTGVAATAVYVAVGTWTADPVLTAVFVWASLGIVFRGDGITEAVRLAAGAGCAAAALVTLISIARRSPGRRAPS
jgi:hypothetical protein